MIEIATALPITQLHLLGVVLTLTINATKQLGIYRAGLEVEAIEVSASGY
ncbi:hypothetical protein [Chroococcidiopsis sp. CCMEE 29]|nr:hypothetical protein [Chroococcidiopsis sp. CCMEE 29]